MPEEEELNDTYDQHNSRNQANQSALERSILSIQKDEHLHELDPEELETIAACFDNIRQLRRECP